MRQTFSSRPRLSLLAALLAATVIAGCGGGDSSDGEEAAGPAGGSSPGGSGGASGSGGAGGAAGAKAGGAGAAGQAGSAAGAGGAGGGGAGGGGAGGAAGTPAGGASGKGGGASGASGSLPGGNGGTGQASGSAGEGGAGASSAGSAGSSGAAGSGGEAGCPTYQSFCNGACIPTSVDPQNCGGCGVACGAGQVCSGGSCESGCLPGLSACGGACVDLGVDGAHCGDCATACPAGEGCAGGKCKPSAVLGAPPAKCVNGGPAIVVTDGAKDKCTGDIAQTIFTWALCSCTDVKSSQTLFIDGFDSTKGPYKPGELGAGLGLDGTLQSSSTMDIWGTLWGSSSTGFSSSSQADVHHELHSGGPLTTTKTFTVAADAWVDGAVSGAVSVGGALHVPDATKVSAKATYGSLVEAPVSVPAPCDCEPSHLLPVGSIVSAHQAKNDNALIGLDPALLAKGGGPSHLDLPCGEYYLDEITSSTPLSIVAHGHVALYVGGDITSSSPLWLTLDPTSTLDIFVGGTLKSSSSLAIGSPNYPALTRVYVESAQTLALTAGSAIAANLYAPHAMVKFSATTEMYGALFAGEVDLSAPTKIHYDRHVVLVGDDECPGGPTGSGGSSGAGGSGAGGGSTEGCNTCGDCGNQACVDGQCGMCTDSAQCCPPLVCVGGSCVLVGKP